MKTNHKPYWQKLQDPKWQRRRTEILQRDNFTCRACGDKEDTLHVHHRWYEKGKEPWEYEDEVLVTLCQDCHKEYEERAASITKMFSNIDEIDCLNKAITGMAQFVSEFRVLQKEATAGKKPSLRQMDSMYADITIISANLCLAIRFGIIGAEAIYAKKRKDASN